jgi:hypothetical protein
MSLPDFSTQSELFSTAGLSASLFAPTDRYRLFAKLVYPKLAAARPALEQGYGAENGRPAIEPVLMMGVSILPEVDGVPDRQAVERLRYHAHPSHPRLKCFPLSRVPLSSGRAAEATKLLANIFRSVNTSR